MEFLGIGPLELVVIFLLVLIVFSPKDLAQAGKTAGRWINRLNKSEAWNSMRQVSKEMQNLPNRLAREAQIEELEELKTGIGLEKDKPAAGRSSTPPMPPAGEPSKAGPPAEAAVPEPVPPAAAPAKAAKDPSVPVASAPGTPAPAKSARMTAGRKSPSIPVAVEPGKRKTSRPARAVKKGSKKPARKAPSRTARKTRK
jgi:Sec-independent protein translocase protein TatA